MTTELRRLLSEGTKGPWQARAVDRTGKKSIGIGPAPTWLFHGLSSRESNNADAELVAAAINALPHLLAVVEAATVLDHAQQPWASGHGPNGPTVDAAWRDLRNALRALEAGR